MVKKETENRKELREFDEALNDLRDTISEIFFIPVLDYLEPKCAQINGYLENGARWFCKKVQKSGYWFFCKINQPIFSVSKAVFYGEIECFNCGKNHA